MILFSYLYVLPYVSFLPLHQQKKMLEIEELSGEYILNGLFPAKIANIEPSFSSIVYSETMRFAIAEVNKNVLQNITSIGYKIFDSYGETSAKTLVEIALNSEIEISKQDWKHLPIKYESNVSLSSCNCSKTETNHQLIGFIGPGYSSSSQLLHDVMVSQPLPMISYTATSSRLSNKELYPYFIRTTPSDAILSRVVMDIILRYEWQYVSIIASDNTWGRSGRFDMLKLLKQHNICVHVDALFRVPYDDVQIKEIVNSLNLKNTGQGSAKIVILYAVSVPTQMILDHVQTLGLKNFTWILVDTSRLSHWYKDYKAETVTGLIAITPYGGKYETYELHLDELFASNESSNAWFNSLLTTRSHESLKLKFQTIIPNCGFVRNGVYAFAHALKQYILEENSNRINISLYLNYILNTNFRGLNDELFRFNKNGDMKAAMFKVMNIQSNTDADMWIENVGNWSSDVLNINKMVMWPGRTTEFPESACSKECPPGKFGLFDLGRKCCWKCIPCARGYAKFDKGEHECTQCSMHSVSSIDRITCIPILYRSIQDYPKYVYTIFTLVLIGTFTTGVTIATVYRFRSTPVIKACNYRLSTVQLIIHLALYLSLGIFSFESNFETCSATVILIGYQETLVISIMLSKTEQLIKVFEYGVKLTSKDIFISNTIGALFIFLVMLAHSLITSLLFAFGKIEVQSISVKETVVEKFCDFDFFLKVHCSFTFILTLICAFQAYRSRNLPNKYNEARNILYATFLKLGLIVLLTLLVASFENGFTKHFLIFMTMFLTNTIIFVIMFIGKFWILIHKPEENTREFFQSAINESVKKKSRVAQPNLQRLAEV